MVTLQMAQMGGFDVIVKVLTTTLPGVVRINRVQNMHGYEQGGQTHAHTATYNHTHVCTETHTHSGVPAVSVSPPSWIAHLLVALDLCLKQFEYVKWKTPEDMKVSIL